jgi:hypothetical protein
MHLGQVRGWVTDDGIQVIDTLNGGDGSLNGRMLVLISSQVHEDSQRASRRLFEVIIRL